MTITLDQLPPAYRKQAEQQLYGNKTHDSGLGTAQPQHKPAGALDSSPPPEVRGLGALGPRPRVRIVMHRLKLLDADNKWYAPKGLLDGIIEASLAPGDSESAIDYQVEQVRVRRAAEVKTEIFIEEEA